MSHYDDRPEDLKQDAKNFLNSTYGKYIVETLEAQRDGVMASLTNLATPHPSRYAAKLSAITDTLTLLKSPLDDDIPPHG